MKRLPNIALTSAPGIFVGWGIHPGGKSVGEYLVCHWPAFQSQGVELMRMPVYTVQEMVADEVPVGEVSSNPFVGEWRSPLAQMMSRGRCLHRLARG